MKMSIRARRAEPEGGAGGLPAVLHPVYATGAFHIWGEVPAGPDVPMPDLGTAQPPHQLHPRHLDGRRLRARLPRPEQFQLTIFEQFLPSAPTAPLPSPAAGGDPAGTGVLRPWGLTGVTLTLPQLLPWLEAGGVPLRDPGLRWSPLWRFWWEAAALVRELVAAGAVVPDIVEWYPGEEQVQWRPVPGREAERHIESLARRIPGAVAQTPSGPNGPLRSFLTEYADALVRSLALERKELSRWRRPRESLRPSPARWLSDLFSPWPAPMGWSPTGQLRRWLRDPAKLNQPGRLVLRLDEPEEGPVADGADGGQARPDPVWTVGIYLESPAEPGVLVPADEVWSGSSVRDQEALRAALVAAFAVLPAVTRCAETHEPEAHLSTEEAWTLLSQGQKRLERLGITVLVPSWWHQHAPTATLRLDSGGSGLFAADALVQFSWQVALGDGTVITAEEFERLVALRTPLVRLSRGWVQLPPGAAESLAARWRDQGTRGRASAGQALLMAVQAEADAGPATEAPPVLADEALREMLAGLSRVPDELPEPAGFRGTLRPYQRRGTAWLHTRAALGLGGILADDMGLGKTIQMLALIARRAQERREAGAEPHPSLIVCPTSVVANWAAEAERFTPELRVLVHLGPARERGSELPAACSASDITVTSYPLLLRDVESLARVEWDGVILDEAQNVKNAFAKQAQAARRLQAHHRFALTGTPVENALSDLWSIFAFLQPGYLGSAETFRKRLALPIERGGDEQALGTLRRLIGPFVLRRTKSEPGVADELPEKVETVERCALTREQAALYEAVARELLQRVQESSGMERRAAVLLALLRLKQVCNHPVHYGVGGALAGRSGKLQRLEELLSEVVAEGQRALVFTQFASWGRRLTAHLREFLPGCPVWNLDGTTPAQERTRLISEFQSGEGPGVFVLSLKAGGAGLNLTAARHVFHYDRWWNPAVERQATDRAYRIGQLHSVQVHALLCVGTLEERIDQLLRQKEGLAEGVLGGGGEAWLTELGDAELREVLMLRRSALAG